MLAFALRSLRLLFCLGLLAFSLCCWGAAAGASAAEPTTYVPPSSPVEPSGPEGAPTCPPAPEIYEGDSEAVAAVYGSQLLDVQLCRALSYRLDRVSDRAWWLVAEGVGSAEQRAESIALLEQIAEAPAPSGSLGEVASVDESGFLSLRYALWFIAAVAVTAIVAYSIVRLVVFRDN